MLQTDQNGNLIGFNEKPDYDFLVSMGVYMVNKSIVSLIPENTFFGFDHLMKLLIQKQQLPTVFEFDGYWLDIGRPDNYEKAINEYDQKDFI